MIDNTWYNFIIIIIYRFNTSSPYYKGLLFTERLPGTSSSEAESTHPTSHDIQNLIVSSPYYKGLLCTERVPGTDTSAEAEGTTANAIPHDLMFTSSPYYKGLLNQATSPDRESVATTIVSSISKTSFSIKISEWGGGCFKFRAKDEMPPTMVKVYSNENSNQESLRERGSEPASPQLSPPLPQQPMSPPPPPVLSPSATKKVVVTANDATEQEEKKYVWADRYRPAVLSDFICNKDKAIELQNMVSFHVWDEW